MSIVSCVSGSDIQLLRAGRRVLNVPSISLGHVACTAIVGPNGAGKSLLVKTLCALQIPDKGEVMWSASPPDSARRQRVGLMLQRPVLLRRTALQNVTYALQVMGITSGSAKMIAQDALAAAGLSALVDVSAYRLSGGEQQRLALVRALVLKPDMLFLDEATANVDPASTLAIEQQLLAAMHDGLNVVLISHDIGQVRRLADEVVLMHNGEIIEQSATQQFFKQTKNPVSLRWLAGEILV